MPNATTMITTIITIQKTYDFEVFEDLLVWDMIGFG
jgi:hypothetical protein